MTGAEHYVEAERMLSASADLIEAALRSTFHAHSVTVLQAQIFQAGAQVHATLALAALTMQDADWSDVTTGHSHGQQP